MSWIRIPMSILSRYDLSVISKLVYCLLADRMGNNGRSWPGARRLAVDLGLRDKRAIFRAVRDLQAAGLISVQPRGRGQSHVYVLNSGTSDVPESGASDAPVRRTHRYVGRTRGGAPDAPEPVRQTHHNPTNRTRLINTRRTGFDPCEVAKAAMTGSSLNTEQLMEAFGQWVEHRRAIKKPVTEQSVKLTIKKLEAWGHDRAIAALRESVANGWTGVFEPRAASAAGQGSSRIGRIESPPNKYEGLAARRAAEIAEYAKSELLSRPGGQA